MGEVTTVAIAVMSALVSVFSPQLFQFLLPIVVIMGAAGGVAVIGITAKNRVFCRNFDLGKTRGKCGKL